MEKVFMAFAETVIPWVEERYGRAAAVGAATLLVALPVIGIIAAIAWPRRSSPAAFSTVSPTGGHSGASGFGCPDG